MSKPSTLSTINKEAKQLAKDLYLPAGSKRYFFTAIYLAMIHGAWIENRESIELLRQKGKQTRAHRRT